MDAVADAIPPLPTWCKAAVASLAAFKIILVAVLPVQAFPKTLYDDALFVRSACHIAGGTGSAPTIS